MPSFTTDDFTMHYELQGTGVPVLCIMGITAPGAYWEDHVSEWNKSFQCITADNRGVGLSDKPMGPYTSAMMADDYANLLDHIGIESAHVVGCSMGSVIAQQLAIKHPQKVLSLVLMCSWARCDEYAKSTFNQIIRAKAHLRSEELLEYLHLLIFDKTSWDDPAFFATMLEARAEAAIGQTPQPLHGLEGQCAACTSHDSYDQLKDIKAPTFIIGGEADIFTPRWMADELAQGIPNNTVHLYPNSGHAFHWENVEDFNDRVAKFISSNC